MPVQNSRSRLGAPNRSKQIGNCRNSTQPLKRRYENSEGSTNPLSSDSNVSATVEVDTRGLQSSRKLVSHSIDGISTKRTFSNAIYGVRTIRKRKRISVGGLKEKKAHRCDCRSGDVVCLQPQSRQSVMRIIYGRYMGMNVASLKIRGDFIDEDGRIQKINENNIDF
ncbi:hypothetical protein ACOME3_001382 [Neoechinorhynchus agilis]